MEYGLKTRRLLRQSGEDPMSGVLLGAGTLLLTRNPFRRLYARSGENESRRKQENNNVVPEVVDGLNLVLHALIIS
jgi:hypothetical protein